MPIPQYAANLKSLRGFKFDWARSDLNHYPHFPGREKRQGPG
jgi:hypothetical protein